MFNLVFTASFLKSYANMCKHGAEKYTLQKQRKYLAGYQSCRYYPEDRAIYYPIPKNLKKGIDFNND